MVLAKYLNLPIPSSQQDQQLSALVDIFKCCKLLAFADTKSSAVSSSVETMSIVVLVNP